MPLGKYKRTPWSSADLEQLKRQYPDTATTKIAASLRRSTNKVSSKAARLGLKKSEQYLASPAACRLRRGDNVGAAHRFKPGLVPWNKGKKGWDSGGRSHETRFKKGRRPHTWLPIGSLRLSKEGYLQRKVTDTDYPPRDWRHVHVLLWVESYGPVPHGYAVGFIDGDRGRITIENLVLFSRADLMRRNTIHNYPPELRHTIRLVAKLNRTIEKRTA